MSSEETNPYELLEISIEATDAEISRAYRQRSLKLHPDKNPDNPNAPKLFHELRQGYELLLDPLRRMALDAKLRLATAKKERYKDYDAKRKAMVADLEEREAAFKKSRADKDREDRARWTDNERIKEEGRKLREERQKRQQQAAGAEAKVVPEEPPVVQDEPPDLGSLDTTVKLKFTISSHPTLTTPEALAQLLAMFGSVDMSTIVISMKPPKKAPQKPPKIATALIPFTAVGAAFAAVSASNRTERGLDGIEVSWAGGSEPPLIGWLKKKGMLGASGGDAPKAPTPLPTTAPGITSSSVGNGDPFSSFPASFAADDKSPAAAASSSVDSESLLLMRMREAERARLEQEILEQEDGS